MSEAIAGLVPALVITNTLLVSAMLLLYGFYKIARAYRLKRILEEEKDELTPLLRELVRQEIDSRDTDIRELRDRVRVLEEERAAQPLSH